MSFDFAPRGWALCNGQLLPINQNQALFALLGTTFGGNGQTNFALPITVGPCRFTSAVDLPWAKKAASRPTRLSIVELTQHIHVLNGTSNASVNTPANNTVLGKSAPQSCYGGPANLVAMDPGLYWQYRRLPSSLEHATVFDVVVLHCFAGHIPIAQLERRTH